MADTEADIESIKTAILALATGERVVKVSLGDKLIEYGAAQLTNLRELVRNDPLAGSGMDTLVANLIGTGITPRWLLDDAALKKVIQELWADWVNEADADGVCDFYGLQALAARAIIEAGEVLIRFRPRRPCPVHTSAMWISFSGPRPSASGW